MVVPPPPVDARVERRSRATSRLVPFLAVAAALAFPAAAGADSYIVVLGSGAAETVAADHARIAGAQVTHVYRHALNGYSADLAPGAVALVRLDPRVAFVARDDAIHAEAKTSQKLPTGVNRVDADVSSTRAGDGIGDVSVGVAVIDSGIAPHTDLNVAGGISCVPGLTSYGDGYGHGTHVAGTIGARDNQSGVVGVAPGARLWSVRVFDAAGAGTWSNVICAVDWLTQNAPALGIHVANMSLAGGGVDDGNCGLTRFDAVHQAICNSVAAGIVYVAAAGNYARDLSGYIPAAYDEVLTATGIADYNGRGGGGGRGECTSPDVDDTAYDKSNFALAADSGHTIAAPAVCILSTSMTGGTTYKTGTSMAAPHVAGAAALCISTGACTGPPAAVVAKLRADAESYAAAAPGYGFAEDPLRAPSGPYYGYLLWAAAY